MSPVDAPFDRLGSVRRSGPCFHARFFLLLILIASLALEGCGFWLRSGETGPQTPPPGGAPPTAGQSGSVTITPQYIALASGQSFKFSASASNGGQIAWLVNGVASGSTTSGTIDSAGNYTAPAKVSQSENVVVTAALAASPQQNYATAVVAVLIPGQVLCPPFTGNPQVALYSIYLPAPGKASVQFGKTTDYGLDTWQVATPSANGGQINDYVAGMLGHSTYHMRGQVVLSNGATFTDADQRCQHHDPAGDGVNQGFNACRRNAATGHRVVEHAAAIEPDAGLRD